MKKLLIGFIVGILLGFAVTYTLCKKYMCSTDNIEYCMSYDSISLGLLPQVITEDSSSGTVGICSQEKMTK